MRTKKRKLGKCYPSLSTPLLVLLVSAPFIFSQGLACTITITLTFQHMLFHAILVCDARTTPS